MGSYSVFDDGERRPRAEVLASMSNKELMDKRKEAKNRRSNFERGCRTDSGVYEQLGEDLVLIEAEIKLRSSSTEGTNRPEKAAPTNEALNKRAPRPT